MKDSKIPHAGIPQMIPMKSMIQNQKNKNTQKTKESIEYTEIPQNLQNT